MQQIHAQYNIVGSATKLSGSDCYKLTSEGANSATGAVWYTDKIDLSKNFQLNFTMNFGRLDQNGADGIVFVLQDTGNNVLGRLGGGLGFDGFKPSFGIEFDTYMNATDPAYDHSAFIINGNVLHNNAQNLAGPVQTSKFSQDVEDDQDHNVRIEWNAGKKILSMYFDCELRLSARVNLDSILGYPKKVFWGFTSSTGGYTNNQTVCLRKDILIKDSFTICRGNQVQISARKSLDNKYKWSPSSNINNTGIQNPIVDPKNSRYYIASYQDACDVTVRDSIWINVLDSYKPNLGNDTLFCGNFTLKLKAVYPGAKVQWNTGESDTVMDVHSAGTYSVELKGGACFEKDTIVISNDLSKLDLGPDSMFCNPDFTPFVLTAPSNYRSFQWSNGSSAQSVNITSTGTLIAQAYNSNNCPSKDTINYSIRPKPFAYIRDTTICKGERVVLDGSNRNPLVFDPIIYYWNQKASAPLIAVKAKGYHILEIQYHDCKVFDTASISFFPFDLELGNDTFFCGPFLKLLKPKQNYLSYLWHDGSSSSTHLAVSPGLKHVTVVNSYSCRESDSILIEQFKGANADLGNDTAICVAADLTLYAPDGNISYKWSTGESGNSIQVNKQGRYILTVVDSNNCTASDTVEVAYSPGLYPSEMYVPSAFSPNRNGLNETFPGNGFTDFGAFYKLSIFNTWGELIFLSEDAGLQWDGSYKNQPVVQGIYMYTIEYTACDGRYRMLKGTVTLLR